ncbi:MAG TPA: M20 family metallopeptidase [Thermoanaerobaculia bacterium]|jgi:glutamate carboxypeptidase|nr:M20 family metallopeptidase [Thermoanaerobaculia bacterium]
MGRLLLDLALLESPSHDPASQEPVFARLAGELEACGLRIRRLPGRRSGGQLWAVRRQRRRGAPAQLLLGHCDTVWPAGTVERMPVEIRDGRLNGPGVYDMKGGLVQGVFALRALRDLGLEPQVEPAVFINSDEELGSGESLVRIERLARHVRRVFVLEPSLGPSGKLKTRRKGSLRFTIRVFGRAAHSGLDPEKGASAIQELARVIQTLYGLADPEREITVNVGVVSGGMRANVVAPEARAELDIRVTSWEDAWRLERTVQELTAVTPGTRLEIVGGIDRPPLEATPGNRVLWEAARRRAEELGIDLDEGTAGGASDGSLTSRFVPTLDGLGAVGDGAHAVHEHVVLDRSPERAALLALLLLEPPLPEG